MTAFPWKLTRSGQEIYFPEGSRRFVSVSVEQIGGDGRLDRAIDGSAIWLGDAAFRRHAVTLSCQGHTAAPVFDVWPGQLVTLECPVEFAVPGPSATLAYDPVAGSVYGVDEDDNRLPGTTVTGRAVSCAGAVAIRYRPVMQCVVASRNADKTQNRADAGWTLRLEDLSGAETGMGEDGDTITFSAPGLQNYTVGTAFSLSLVSSVTSSTGLPLTFDLVSGALPAGLSLSSAGVISGTPTAYGVSVAVVRATSGGVAATQTVPFFDAVPTIGSIGLTLRDYTVGTAFSLPLSSLYQASSDEVPSALLVAGELPPGLGLVGNAIAGTPNGPGIYSATFLLTLPTGAETESTVAFFAQDPNALPDAIISGGTFSSAQIGGPAVNALGQTLNFQLFRPSGTLSLSRKGRVRGWLKGGGAPGGNCTVSGVPAGGGAGGEFLEIDLLLEAGDYAVSVAASAAPGSTLGNNTTLTRVSDGLVVAIAYGGSRGGNSNQAGVDNSNPGGSAGGAGANTTSLSQGVAAGAGTAGGWRGGNGNRAVSGTVGGGGGGAGDLTTAGTTGRQAGHNGLLVKAGLLGLIVPVCGGGNGGQTTGTQTAPFGGGGLGGIGNANGTAGAANSGAGGGGAGSTLGRTGGAGAAGEALFWVRIDE